MSEKFCFKLKMRYEGAFPEMCWPDKRRTMWEFSNINDISALKSAKGDVSEIVMEWFSKTSLQKPCHPWTRVNGLSLRHGACGRLSKYMTHLALKKGKQRELPFLQPSLRTWIVWLWFFTLWKQYCRLCEMVICLCFLVWGEILCEKAATLVYLVFFYCGSVIFPLSYLP